MEIVESLNHQYLRMVIKQETEEAMESYRSRILQKNKVPSLLSLDRRYIDGVSYCYYEVTAMCSMENTFLNRKITEMQLDQLFESLEHTLFCMEEYLLKAGDLCLKPEYIMEDSETGQWNFLYIPDYSGSQKQDVENIAEFMLDHIDCSEEMLMERVYEFYSDLLQSGEQIGVSEILRIWKRSKKEKVQEENGDEEMENADVEESEEIAQMKEKEKTRWREKVWQRRIYKVPYRGDELT